MSRLANYWSGKSVVITGASSGLGEEIVEALSPFNISFCLLARREEAMKAIADKYKNSGSTFWIRSCDVKNRESVESAIQDFHRHAGRIDAVWVNSGISRETSYQNWDWNTFDDVLDTNLKGAIYTTNACLDVMVPQGYGTVIGICSAASMRGLGARGIYSITKIGLAYHLESMAVELPQIQTVAIHPGFVDTDINQGKKNLLWLVETKKAVQLMVNAVAKGKRVYIFPFRMMVLYKVMRILPMSVYLWLARKLIDVSRPKK